MMSQLKVRFGWSTESKGQVYRRVCDSTYPITIISGLFDSQGMWESREEVMGMKVAGKCVEPVKLIQIPPQLNLNYKAGSFK